MITFTGENSFDFCATEGNLKKQSIHNSDVPSEMRRRKESYQKPTANGLSRHGRYRYPFIVFLLFKAPIRGFFVDFL
jgi:hypothetical protein